MIDYDSCSLCHLTDIFFRYFRGSKRAKARLLVLTQPTRHFPPALLAALPPINMLAIKVASIETEAFYYNTTNQSNHYVTELFEIKIHDATQNLKSLKNKSSKSIEWFGRYQCLYFGPSLVGALHLLNNLCTLHAFVEVEK